MEKEPVFVSFEQILPLAERKEIKAKLQLKFPEANIFVLYGETEFEMGVLSRGDDAHKRLEEYHTQIHTCLETIQR